MKESKGITLVALIITIIVLLILAVVTINAVNEGNLFAHANNAATAYSKSQEEENTMISNWLTELEKHDKGQNRDENPQLQTDLDDIRGTYYAANGNENYTIVISDDNISIGEILGTYDYSDGMISASFNNGAFIFNYNYSTLEDGTKVLLCTVNPRGTASLLATDISKLTTGTLTGTYNDSNSTNGINFKNATEVELLKIGSVEKTKTYKYFTQYNIISIGEEAWFKLEENALIEFIEGGTTHTYIKQD